MDKSYLSDVATMRIEKTNKTLLRKREEYAEDESPFHNFYSGAVMLAEKPIFVAWAYATKHFVSIQDMAEGRKEISKELIDEKFGDAVCYLLIIMSMELPNQLDADKMRSALEELRLDNVLSGTFNRKAIESAASFHNHSLLEWLWGSIFVRIEHLMERGAMSAKVEYMHLIKQFIRLEAYMLWQLK